MLCGLWISVGVWGGELLVVCGGLCWIMFVLFWGVWFCGGVFWFGNLF